MDKKYCKIAIISLGLLFLSACSEDGFDPISTDSTSTGGSVDLGNNPPSDCDNLPHGESETREMYLQGTVAFGESCDAQVETQTRVCADGSLSNWSGQAVFDQCNVLDAMSCGNTPHQDTEVRTMYEVGAVPFGESCVAKSETQTRLCDNGTFGDWSGQAVFDQCSVLDAMSCGNTPHQDTEVRTMYEVGAVPFGESCAAQSEAQTRLCDNGKFGDWSGTYNFPQCQVQGPLPDDDPPVTPPDPVGPNPLDVAIGWTSVENSSLSSACPTGVDCTNVVEAWNSAAMDTTRNRLLLFGGGHGDYSGNEIYAFDLNTLSMNRLTEPTSPAVTGCDDLGSLPSSRHTYDGLAFVPGTDSLLSFAGASYPTGCPSGAIWSYGFTDNQWNKRYNGPILEGTGGGTASAYSPVDEVVYLIDSFDLFSYSDTTGALVKLTNGAHGLNPTYSVMTYIESKNWLVAHDSSDGDFKYFDLNEPIITAQNFNTSGPQTILDSYYPGMIYYPHRDSLIGYPGSGKSIYELNLNTGVWTASTPPGFDPGSGPSGSRGTFERFNYSEQSNVFVLVKNGVQDVMLLRLD